MSGKLRRVAIWIAAVLVAQQAWSQPASLANPEVYGALPTVADVEIAPDGRWIASIRNDGKGALVAIHDLSLPGSPAAGLRLENVKPRSLAWASNDVLLVLASQTIRGITTTGRQAMETWRWLAVSRKDMTSRMIFGHEPGYYVTSPGTLLSSAPGDKGSVVFSRWTSRRTIQDDSTLGSRLESKSSGGGLSLFAYDLGGGREQLLGLGNGNTDAWVVDASGNAMLRIDRNGARAQVYARKEDGSGLALRGTIEAADGGMPSVQGRAATDGGLLATVEREGRVALAHFDLQGGTAGEVLPGHARYDVSDVLYDPRVAAVSGVAYTDDLPRRNFLDPDLQHIQASIAAALPDAAPVLWSRADKDKYVFKVEYTDHPPQWFIYDAGTKALDMFAPSYEALDGKVHARKEKYDYTASDGLLIPGYLTVPAGASRQAMPLVVLPHGGPHARDDQAFDYWAFF